MAPARPELLYKLDEVRAEYEQCANPNKQLVAYEVPYASTNPERKGKTCYGFKVVDMDEFITMYCAWPLHFPRRWHEIISRDQRVKLYVDMDIEGSEMVDAEASLQEAITQIKEFARTRLGEEDLEDPIILDASTRVKFSVHLIYPTLWFVNPQHAHAFVQGIPKLDLAVYTMANNVNGHNFRLPFSEKHKKNNPLLVRGVDGGKEAITPEVFCRSLVSWISTDPTSPYHSFLPEPTRVHRLAGVSDHIHRGLGVASLEMGDEVRGRAQRILDYIKYTRGEFQESYIAVDERGEWNCSISPPLPCPTNGRMHRNQNMYLGSKDCRRVYMRCPDELCRSTVYLPEDFSPIAFRFDDYPQVPALQGGLMQRSKSS